MHKQPLFMPFRVLLLTCGVAACLVSARDLQYAQFDIRFLILACATIFIASRISIRIPWHGGEIGKITVSDTFVFLIMLFYGGAAAVLVATAEAFCSASRFNKRKLLVIQNTAMVACSTFVTAGALRLAFGSITNLPQREFDHIYVVAICLMALAQYITNTGIASLYTAIKTHEPVWRVWVNSFLWTSVTYFAGAAAAGIIAKLSNVVGFYALVGVLPIVAILYLTYRMYLKNVEASIKQVEQAELHLAQMQESEERFRNAFDYASVGMALVSTDGRWREVNHSLCRLLGYTEAELLERDFQSLTHHEDLPAALEGIDKVRRGEIPAAQTEKRYLHKDGREVWTVVGVSRLRDAPNDSSPLIFQVQDITDRKCAEERLVHDARHDALTGLPNRLFFLEQLQTAISRDKRDPNYQFAVLFLDLDRFKIINDSLGHNIGDQLLIGIARRLESCLRPGDIVARLGGDEFTVLLEGTRETAEAVQIAGRIASELARPFVLGGQDVFTSTSIGIASSVIGYDLPDEVLRDADTAMYRAKSLGKSQYQVFDRAMHQRAVNILQLESDLRRAIERDEFVLHYQPIVALETGAVTGLEALIRWRHPERGMIPPSDFIPIAEETGLINQIGDWALAEACRQARVWADEFERYPVLSVCVNLSAKQFAKPGLLDHVRRVLDETKLKPGSLKVEITESIVMENTEATTFVLEQLRALGVESSIDDFGTGYSSLSYLHRFPASTLKIDRSFVTRMGEQNENKEIVRTIVTLARNLGMSVVAEGVETLEQLATLRSLGCDFGQGYYFSRPADAASIGKILAETHPYPCSVPMTDTLIELNSPIG